LRELRPSKPNIIINKELTSHRDKISNHSHKLLLSSVIGNSEIIGKQMVFAIAMEKSMFQDI